MMLIFVRVSNEYAFILILSIQIEYSDPIIDLSPHLITSLRHLFGRREMETGNKRADDRIAMMVTSLTNLNQAD